MIERGSLRLLLSFAGLGLRRARGSLRGRRGAALRHLRTKQTESLGLRGVEVHSGISQHLRSNSLLFAQQSEQEVLGAYIAVTQIASLAHRELEYFLGAGCIGKIGSGRGCGLPLLHGLLDFLLNLVEVDTEILQDRGGDAFALADQSEQYVLGADVFVMEPCRLLTRHGEDLSYSLCEVVPVHRCNPQCGSRFFACLTVLPLRRA